MKTYWGSIAPPFLTSTVDGGEWLASRPSRFTPGERSPAPILTRLGWPQRRFGHYEQEKRLLLLPVIEFHPLGCPAHLLVSVPTEISRLLVEL
jgi:hypothetical protein